MSRRVFPDLLRMRRGPIAAASLDIEPAVLISSGATVMLSSSLIARLNFSLDSLGLSKLEISASESLSEYDTAILLRTSLIVTLSATGLCPHLLGNLRTCHV